MKPLDEIKYRKFKRKLSMILDIIAIVIAFIVDHFMFDNSIPRLIVCILMYVIIAEAIRIAIQTTIEKSPNLRKRFESDEPVKKTKKGKKK